MEWPEASSRGCPIIPSRPDAQPRADDDRPRRRTHARARGRVDPAARAADRRPRPTAARHAVPEPALDGGDPARRDRAVRGRGGTRQRAAGGPARNQDAGVLLGHDPRRDRDRLNSSHEWISYAVFCLKKKKKKKRKIKQTAQ